MIDIAAAISRHLPQVRNLKAAMTSPSGLNLSNIARNDRPWVVSVCVQSIHHSRCVLSVRRLLGLRFLKLDYLGACLSYTAASWPASPDHSCPSCCDPYFSWRCNPGFLRLSYVL